MIILEIIEYFRSLASKHQNISCFKTGEAYEKNHDGSTYPLLFLNTNFKTSFSSTKDLLDEEYIYITLNLSVLTLSRESEQESIDNQIKAVDNQRLQDLDIALTHQILTQIILKSIKDANEDFLNGWIITGDNNGLAVKRVINDDCDGWELDITLKIHNSNCDYESYFGDDVIDSGQNKTQYQVKTNINPIEKSTALITEQ